MKKYVKINNTYEPFISKYWAPRDDSNILPAEEFILVEKML